MAIKARPSAAAGPNRLDRPLDERLDERLARPLGDWQGLLQRWRASDAGRALVAEIDRRVAAGAAVYPRQVFRAFELTPLARTRVVVLGQDPYHGPGQAEGLAFSVADGMPLPPSLRNIFKELQRDLGQAAPASGSLVRWAERGVLLLNTTLTVEDGRPGSHAGLGWSALTDAVVQALAADRRRKAILLWGAHAQAHARSFTAAGAGHLVLQCSHPSPLSALRGPAPFIGCGHFGQVGRFLARAGQEPIDWTLC